ncbi:MAG: DUF502 domain-containing protein [Sedimentisphaerales bacterium]|nr:DUF502 domain-containing protein [Sedimentisphaerales bacterium]
MKKLIDYFIKGLLIFVPIGLTVFLLIWAFTSLDKAFRGLLRGLVGIDIPAIGLLLTVALITMIGFLASNFLGRRFFELIEKIFRGLPLVKLLYSAVKDMIEAFAGEKKSFDKPVLAAIAPGSAVKIVGFITRESLENFGLTDYVAVYMPQSYNFAGNVLLFPKESITPLKVESSQAMAFIVSGGVSCGS